VGGSSGDAPSMGRSRMDTSVTNQGRGKKELARLFKEIKDLPRQIAENSSRNTQIRNQERTPQNNLNESSAF